MTVLKEPLVNTDFDIPKIEKKFNARFICETPLLVGDSWNNSPSLIFYSDVPHPQGSNWFAVTRYNDQAIISNAIDIVNQPITGIKADDGSIIYSHCRHDMRTSPDQSVWIDGGRDYVRTGNASRLVTLRIANDQLVEAVDHVQDVDLV